MEPREDRAGSEGVGNMLAKTASKYQFKSVTIAARNISDMEVAELCRKGGSKDPYMLSPSYINMTGRHGKMHIFTGASHTYLVSHPNVSDTQMIFYPLADSYAAKLDLLSTFFKVTNPQQGMHMQIGRVPRARAAMLARHLNGACKKWHFDTIREPVLDWKYPVYTLDTKKVAMATGSDMSDFRNNLNRFFEKFPDSAVDDDFLHRGKSMTDIPFDSKNEAHLQALQNLAHRWAGNKARSSISPEYIALRSPYRWIEHALREGALDLDGVILFVNQREAAVVLWDKPTTTTFADQKIADLFFNNLEQIESRNILLPSKLRERKPIITVSSPAAVYDSSLFFPGCEHIKGMSEFIQWSMCRTLAASGIDRVCIGGSETEGLDRFKRKMRPVESLDLCTIAAYPAV